MGSGAASEIPKQLRDASKLSEDEEVQHGSGLRYFAERKMGALGLKSNVAQ